MSKLYVHSLNKGVVKGLDLKGEISKFDIEFMAQDGKYSLDIDIFPISFDPKFKRIDKIDFCEEMVIDSLEQFIFPKTFAKLTFSKPVISTKSKHIFNFCIKSEIITLVLKKESNVHILYFRDSIPVQNLILPPTLERIYSHWGISNLVSITFDSESDRIQFISFASWIFGIKQIILPKKCESLIDFASSMRRGTKIEFNSDSHIIGSDNIVYPKHSFITTYCNKGIKSAVIRRGIQRIGTATFMHCMKLTCVTIPESVQEIGTKAFYHCVSLIKVLFMRNSKLRRICESSFYDCKLKNLYFPESLRKIESQAFYSNKRLRFVKFHANSKVSIAYDSFGCTDAKIVLPNYYDLINVFSLTNNPNNEAKCIDRRRCLVDDDDIYYHRNKAIIDYCDSKKTRILIRRGTKLILSSVFNECKISFITFPASLIKICSFAFEKCENLKRVDFEQNSRLRFISKRAFFRCTNLRSFKCPASLRSIGEETFFQCKYLESFSFCKDPELQIIKNRAFSCCISLKTFLFPRSLLDIKFDSFENCHALNDIKCEGNEQKFNDIIEAIYDNYKMHTE